MNRVVPKGKTFLLEEKFSFQEQIGRTKIPDLHLFPGTV